MSALALTLVLGVAAKIVEGVSASRRRLERIETDRNLRKCERLFAALEAKGFCVPGHGDDCRCYRRNYVRAHSGKCDSWWIRLESMDRPYETMTFVACCPGVEPLAVVRVDRHRGRPGIGCRTTYRYLDFASLCPACGRAEWRLDLRSDPVEGFIQGGSVRAFAFGTAPADASGPYR